MYRVTAVAIVLMLPVSAAAADEFDPAVAAKAIAPYLDDQVFAIGHADLTRIDLEKGLAFFKDLGKFEDKEFEEAAKHARDFVASFLKAGGKDLYVVLSIADFPNNGPYFFVVPLTENANGDALGKLLGQGQMKHAVLKNALIVGAEKTVERLKDQKPTERPEVAKAIAAAGDTAVQVLLVPTKDNRRVIEEIYLPKIPVELGGSSTMTLTRGVQWLAVGVNLPPKPSAHLVIQSLDAGAAKELHKAILQVVEAINKLPADSEESIASLVKLVTALTPEVKDDRLTVSVGEKTATTVLGPVVAKIREAAKRAESTNNLHQIAIAMLNYADTHRGRLPAAYSVDKDGKPLLSWRVHILPFIAHDNLYKQFHLDEPWDSEHNKKLIPLMPETYLSSDKLPLKRGLTTYLAPVGDATIFPGKDGIRFPADIPDGTSNTVMFVDVEDKDAVTWTKPEDLKVDPKKPEAGLANRQGKGYLMAFADGSVRVVSGKIDKKTLWAIFTRNGGEVVNIP